MFTLFAPTDRHRRSRPSYIKFGGEQISYFPAKGIVAAHIPPLVREAELRNTIIMIRPVEEVSLPLIEAGSPTKNYKIKGNSSNFGPVAGYIPVDQAHSKNFADPVKVAKANAQVSDCISKGHGISVPLCLTLKRLCYLRRKGLIQWQEKDGGHLTIRCEMVNAGAKYFARRRNDGTYQIYDKNRKSVQVVAHPTLREGFTADYDLLIVGPNLAEYGSADKTPLPNVTYNHFKSLRRSYSKEQLSAVAAADKENYYAVEDPCRGNVSVRINSWIDLLNKALNCGKYRELVHHNADETSPAAKRETILPATVILPVSIDNCPRAFEIRTHKDLSALLRCLRGLGYNCKANPRWGDEYKALRRPAFNQAIEQLEANLKFRKPA